LTKNNQAHATDPHISAIGHITIEELLRYLSATEQANGLGNRFLWVCVRRSKVLPRGGRIDEATLAPLRDRLIAAALRARGLGEITFDETAGAIWDEVYAELSEGRPGLVGAMLGRAEAHVLRLSIIYAALDGARAIREPHLMAALAVWQYVEQSVKHIFGDAIGGPVADEILRLLRAAPEGLSRNQLYDHFGRHQSSDRIGKALAMLAANHLATVETQQTGGRPREVWKAARQ
jgi:hypothetical protein